MTTLYYKFAAIKTRETKKKNIKNNQYNDIILWESVQK